MNINTNGTSEPREVETAYDYMLRPLGRDASMGRGNRPSPTPRQQATESSHAGERGVSPLIPTQTVRRPVVTTRTNATARRPPSEPTNARATSTSMQRQRTANGMVLQKKPTIMASHTLRPLPQQESRQPDGDVMTLEEVRQAMRPQGQIVTNTNQPHGMTMTATDRFADTLGRATVSSRSHNHGVRPTAQQMITNSHSTSINQPSSQAQVMARARQSVPTAERQLQGQMGRQQRPSFSREVKPTKVLGAYDMLGRLWDGVLQGGIVLCIGVLPYSIAVMLIPDKFGVMMTSPRVFVLLAFALVMAVIGAYVTNVFHCDLWLNLTTPKAKRKHGNESGHGNSDGSNGVSSNEPRVHRRPVSNANVTVIRYGSPNNPYELVPARRFRRHRVGSFQPY